MGVLFGKVQELGKVLSLFYCYGCWRLEGQLQAGRMAVKIREVGKQEPGGASW